VLRSYTMVSHKIRDGNLKLTLSIHKEILENFKLMCGKEGWIVSKQMEKFMEEEFEKWQKQKD
jgi:hypothetical protein